ncbi:hypothetical protein [Sphingomonas abietis]|uniref:Uncharacterized protein n=1 Tax=Sphingomonas abietis TaxID=3012344 RepID=A0ABY7NLR4_9SPHN|nr:hypothetical protein [Sphingomonas abietis]WBO22293.1 hypothetical protein PBT88_19455 [Sphingomonas abietis]
MTRQAELLASEQMRDRIAADMAAQADEREGRGNVNGRKQAALLRAWVRHILAMPGRLAVIIHEEDMRR